MIGTVLLVACASVLVHSLQTDERAHGYSPVTSAQATRSSPTDVPTRPSPHPLPRGAIKVATLYASASFSTTTGVMSDAWISSVAEFSTPAWHRHLLAATNEAVMSSTTNRPRVLRVFPSWAPRGEVGATVLLLDQHTQGYESIYLDLDVRGGRYLVAAAQ